jgi:hypothetical protein
MGLRQESELSAGLWRWPTADVGCTEGRVQGYELRRGWHARDALAGSMAYTPPQLKQSDSRLTTDTRQFGVAEATVEKQRCDVLHGAGGSSRDFLTGGDCATWLHRAREMPKEQFRRDVEMIRKNNRERIIM